MVSAMWSGRWDVRWFESLGSTNSYLLEQAAEGAFEGMVAVADHQRAGRAGWTVVGSRRRVVLAHLDPLPAYI